MAVCDMRPTSGEGSLRRGDIRASRNRSRSPTPDGSTDWYGEEHHRSRGHYARLVVSIYAEAHRVGDWRFAVQLIRRQAIHQHRHLRRKGNLIPHHARIQLVGTPLDRTGKNIPADP